jgi:hypothetical protein
LHRVIAHQVANDKVRIHREHRGAWPRRRSRRPSSRSSSARPCEGATRRRLPTVSREKQRLARATHRRACFRRRASSPYPSDVAGVSP